MTEHPLAALDFDLFILAGDERVPWLGQCTGSPDPVEVDIGYGEPQAGAAWCVVTTERRQGERFEAVGGALPRTVEMAAADVVFSLLLGQAAAPAGLSCSGDDVQQWGKDVLGVARESVEAFRVPGRGWNRHPLHVRGERGEPFALWLHERAEGYAGVADLGSYLIAVRGSLPSPRRWTLDVLSPDEARRSLT